MTPDSIRLYLQRYRREGTLKDVSGVLKNGDLPPDPIRDRQRKTLGEPDEHVIPIKEYEYRINGRNDQQENEPRYIAFEDRIGLVESAWDTLVARHGLEAVSTYRPFHEDVATSGIYISQRGLRYLGHLLYHWSRVGSYTESREQQTTALQTNPLTDNSRVFAGSPAFDNVEDALALAQEIFARYHWFHHQLELAVAYLEDARDEQLYQEYTQHQAQTSANQGHGLSAALSLSLVRRSRACRELAPDGLYLPLFDRMVAAIQWNQIDPEEFYSRAGFEDGCRELTARVYAGKFRHSPGEELAARIPIETDLWAVVESNFSAYITRRESDPNNGSYAINEAPLGETWSVETSDEWDRLYEKADGSVIDQLDSEFDKLDGRAMAPGLKGHGEGPKDTFYRNLTKGDRYVLKVDNASKEITLLGFGDHDYPKKFGLHVD